MDDYFRFKLVLDSGGIVVMIKMAVRQNQSPQGIVMQTQPIKPYPQAMPSVFPACIDQKMLASARN
jgi:hypothetical protein